MNRSIEINTTTKLITEECYACGVVFAIPSSLNDKCRRNGATFYCPNGHGQVYAETREMKLRHQLDQREGELEMVYGRLNGALKEITVKKREATRLKNRVKAGVCTECHRHFENLQRHMESKHK